LTRYHWFRIGNDRLFYLIDKKQAVVVIVDLQAVRRVA
jgi:mRNA-degrading endonuclease RelE of RelBE toxin-antitoxin system